MIAYFVWVAIGVAGAFVARRWQGDVTGLDARERTGVLLLAIGGAILGAYAFQLPADVWGWNAPLPAGGTSPDGAPLGGRTVLGGMLGGWIAVELGKRAFGITRPTGDAFALPLAIALGFGRMACWSAGCCAGHACAPSVFASVDAAGTPRMPVQLIEVAFHAVCAAWLAIATRRSWLRGRRLAAYVTAYAIARFTLEFWRLQPTVIVGLTYHQLLSIALAVLAGATWWSRRHGNIVASPRPVA